MIYSGDPTINPLNDWLRDYGIWISLIVAGVVFLIVLVLFIIALTKKKGVDTPLKGQVKTFDIDEVIVKALGGKENILSKSLNGSRIVLTLNDYDKVDEVTLNNNGVDSLIRMSNKITLVSKDNSDKIYNSLP